MQTDTELNYEGIYRYLKRYCDNESLLWGVIADCYLNLDTSLSVGEQASYIKSAALGKLKDEWKHQKKYVIMSRLSAEQQAQSEDKITEFVDTIQYQHFQEAASDKELILQTLEQTPQELRKPVALVLNGIFENDVGKINLSIDGIRMFLDRQGYILQGVPLREVARRVYDIIVNQWRYM